MLVSLLLVVPILKEPQLCIYSYYHEALLMQGF